MQVFVTGGEQTLRIAGELDIATQPLLANAIDGMDIEAADVITLDMRRLRFLDSSGLHVILVLRDYCERAATELRIIPGPMRCPARVRDHGRARVTAVSRTPESCQTGAAVRSRARATSVASSEAMLSPIASMSGSASKSPSSPKFIWPL